MTPYWKFKFNDIFTFMSYTQRFFVSNKTLVLLFISLNILWLEINAPNHPFNKYKWINFHFQNCRTFFFLLNWFYSQFILGAHWRTIRCGRACYRFSRQLHFLPQRKVSPLRFKRRCDSFNSPKKKLNVCVVISLFLYENV